MLHRALFGSLERFIGILIEHYAGKLPLWLSPIQAVVLPISSEFDNYAKKIFEEFVKAGINVEMDLINQKDIGTIWIRGYNEITDCKGIKFQIAPFNDICMFGKK